jgi:hypothetical protein
MTIEAELADGRILEFPDGTDPSVIQATVKRMLPASTERTFGEAVKDVGAGVVSGTGALMQLPGQLYGLATGDMEDSGLLGAGKDVAEYGQEMKSPGLKAREEVRTKKVEEAAKEGQFSAFKTALSETVKDPGLLLNFLAEQAPQLVVPFGVGRGVAAGARAMGVGAEAAAGLGASAGVGTGVVQQGADVGASTYEKIYQELKDQGADDTEASEGTLNLARAAGASAGLVSVLTNKLPGARKMEEILAGVPAVGGRIGRGAKTAAGEVISEMPEEVGGQISQNLAMREVKPDQDIMEGTGETAAMAAIGGAGLGGATGLAGRARPEAIAEPEVPETPEAPTGTAPTAPLTAIEAPKAREVPKLRGPDERLRLPGPMAAAMPVATEPVAAEPMVEPEFTDPEREALSNYTTGEPTADVFTGLQNRDRATPASIQQMKSISSKPDYDRLKVSPDFAQGAPVVMSDLELPQGNMGRTEMVTAADGRKIPVRYAVVSAKDVMTSHDANGQKIPGYANAEQAGLRAVAGNGRIAGLQAAYAGKTAGAYAKRFAGDTQHGISPEAIAAIKDPVLIRVMPKSYVSKDIGDVSNISAGLGFNPVEKAKNDSSRFDLNGLQFTEGKDGSLEINEATATQFVRAMPKTEQAEMMDSKGKPNTMAMSRLNNAIFHKAYNSDTLIDLFAQATDPEARLILRGMQKAAPKAFQLEGAGEYDIRQNIIDAAELAINARRDGVKLKDYVKQGMIDLDPNTRAVLEMFADNSRSGVRMGEMLSDLADKAYQQSKTGDDMFGAVPKIPVKDLFSFPKPVKTEEPVAEPAKPAAVKPEPTTPAKPAKPTTKAEPKDFESTKSMEQIAKEITGMTIPQLAQWAVDNAPNSAAKAIAEKVFVRVADFGKRGMFPKKLKILNDKQHKTNGVRGYAKSSMLGNAGVDIELVLNGLVDGKSTGFTGTQYQTILHELTHVATVVQINFAPNSKEANDLNVLLKKVKSQLAIDAKKPVRHPIVAKISLGSNTVKDTDELLAWGFTNPEFQDYLSTIKVGETTAFGRLASIVRNLLGLDAKYETALDALMRTGETLLDLPASELQKSLRIGVLLKGQPKKSTTRKAEQVITKESRVGDMAEKATEAAKEALQKRKPIAREALKDVDPDYVDKLGKVFNPQSDTIIDRIASLKDGFWRRAAQGIADQYRTIKDYSEESYMLARISKSIDGALEGLLFHGHVFNDGGALNIDAKGKGLLDALKPVGLETDRYMMWIALNREARLPKDKRSPNLADLLDGRETLSAGKLDGKSRLDVYRQVQKDMNALNKSVLDVALGAGLINSSVKDIAALRERTDLSEKEINDKVAELQQNPGAYERFTADIFYIPFYKQMEDGDLQGASTASGLTSQSFSKALEGKNDKPFGDLMENTLRNWSHILSASMKNQASKSTLDAAMNVEAALPNLKPQYAWQDGQVVNAKTGEVVGDGSLQFAQTKSAKGMVKIMVNGSPAYFEVLDPMLLDAISSIGYTGPKSKFLDVARDFKNILQYGVTLSPAFKVRNLIRDSVSALAVSGLKKNPVANVIEGLSISDAKSPLYISALAGGAIFNFGSAYEGDQARLVKRLLKLGVQPNSILNTQEKIKKALMAAHDAYEVLGNKSEAANRMALYKQMRDKGMSHLEASYQARDLLDFSMQGSYPAFRLLTQVVPFLNARVQGLYKLGRDGVIPTARVIYNTTTGKEIDATDRVKAQQFSIVASAVGLASLALYFAFKDDEDFKARDEWDRDNFWWFKLPGMDQAFRIPKPFELGAFGTIAERVAEQIFSEGAEGKQIEESMKRMLGDTFSLNPTPQIIKPLLDLYANKDSFTGAPIESSGMERLSKQERITDNTSPLAILVGGVANIALPEKTEMSPVQVDYAIKAYFGWLGGSASWLSHYATMPFKDGAKPDNRWTDTLSMGFIKELPASQSKYVTSFYDNAKEIGQAYADMRHYASLGDSEKVEKILEEKGDKIALAKFYDKNSKDMAQVRAAIRVITNDKTMPGDQKKEEIDRLKLIISEIAKQAESVRRNMAN